MLLAPWSADQFLAIFYKFIEGLYTPKNARLSGPSVVDARTHNCGFREFLALADRQKVKALSMYVCLILLQERLVVNFS